MGSEHAQTTRWKSWATIQKFPVEPNQFQIQVVKELGDPLLKMTREPYKMEEKRTFSQEINVNSFSEELSSSERTGRPVETDVIQTHSSEDRKSLNVEQAHERTVRPVATLNTADTKDSSRVRSCHGSDYVQR